MKDPNLVNDARRVMEKLRAVSGTLTERDLGVHHAVLTDLERRGWIRNLGGDQWQMTREGRAVR